MTLTKIPSPLDHPIAFTVPRRLSEVTNWQEHTPFAMYLVDVLRPRTIVELGTHRGDSYCSLCQAVMELGLESRCYAIDTWTGDAHAGTYGADVLADLKAHHDPLYRGFSELLQMTFDEALGRFPDGSIDLLHIDGCHSYDAVRHDFDSWLPKLSTRAVVLLHDTALRLDDFGVWRLVEELRREFPLLEFAHGNGLGVVVAGPEAPASLRALAAVNGDELAALRSLFAALGAGVRLAGEVHRSAGQRERQQATSERLEAALVDRDRQLSETLADIRDRLARVEALTDALAGSRVLRLARLLRGARSRP